MILQMIKATTETFFFLGNEIKIAVVTVSAHCKCPGHLLHPSVLPIITCEGGECPESPPPSAMILQMIKATTETFFFLGKENKIAVVTVPAQHCK